ncbi:MAG: hypothetical protein WA425_13890 [Xanthobacteraceae bacterium]|jgi:hypothetical protein
MPNFLEQLVAEWYEFNGYFVNRNIHVGRRPQGGWECELDVVAFNPKTKHLVHIEPSTDADRWDKRETRFRKKFDAGQKYIPQLFESFQPLPEIERIALFVLGSDKEYPRVGGGRVVMIKDFMQKIRPEISSKSVFKSAIPEKYVILRTLQFAAQFWQ